MTEAKTLCVFRGGPADGKTMPMEDCHGRIIIPEVTRHQYFNRAVAAWRSFFASPLYRRVDASTFEFVEYNGGFKTADEQWEAVRNEPSYNPSSQRDREPGAYWVEEAEAV